MEHAHLYPESIYGSNKLHVGTQPLENVLSSIKDTRSIRLPLPSSIKHTAQRRRAASHAMSIESLLDSTQPRPQHTSHRIEKRRRATMSNINEHNETDEMHIRFTKLPRIQHPPSPSENLTTMTCYHAAVAQKSYGSEKRFLCPPPIVSIEGKSSYPLVSMAVVCENGERLLEQKVQLDDDQRGSFRFLHVAGTAKAKQFYLRVSLTHNPASNCYAISPPPAPPYVSFVSSPVTIISKPSKKTCKARSVSSCIVSSAPVALFNRINSQTVRTKYLATDDGRLCAKNSMWSPFDIIVLRQPPADEGGSEIMDTNAPYGGMPIVYGSEIKLRDTQSGIESPPLYIRKVDKGRIVHTAEGPVSQMQKVALQLASSNNDNEHQRMYLSAAGPAMNPSSPTQSSSIDDNGSNNNINAAATWLEFVSSRVVADKPRQDPAERVDDFVTWTIVGIAKFHYNYVEPIAEDSNNVRSQGLTSSNVNVSSSHTHSRTMPQPSPPPSPPPRRIMPLPLVSAVRCYDMGTLELTGQHLIQPSNGRLLDVWLGAHGPLHLKNQIHLDDGSLTLIFQLPSLHNLAAAHHGNLVAHSDGTQRFELPLLLMRQDGSMFPSGKGIACSLLPSGLPTYPVYIISRG
ncbi:hypothetical protein O0I10_008097 [Lichtheimia ornata]|uniref:Uncharacterized protein n=1 Tax=Lichtheimia ornata TaxID=688661 RepID=A0AAD7XX86_9FUNG|nr:uncharacterized protein O0I10_008097 [Lichtheimia ornata]KAJ8656303.1 hypothetical protein O0I10_008097 [Lichtheimia ornata]